jgi:hypothetical protein
VGTQPYAGRLRVDGETWRAADPATGRVEEWKVSEGRLEVSLPGRAAILLVGP